MTTEEIIDPPTAAVTVYHAEPVGLSRAAAPDDMIELASSMATALKRIVDKQGLFANINGKKFPTVEAWATIARMDNVVAQESEGHPPVRLENGSYNATVELVRLSDMAVIGRASALCGSPDDKPWCDRPENVRRSMAVTRATSRAFRQHYSWIMALAGYEPTPAEEMPHENAASAPRTAQDGPQAPRAVSEAAPPPSAPPGLLQGVVEKAPDGIRKVKLARDAGNEHYKLEVVMKVDRSRHTIMLLDDASHRGEVLGLKEGDVIRAIGGAVELIEWQEGKPKKKEVWGCTDVAVLRDGVWITGAEAAPSMPLEDPENRRSGPEAAADPTPTTPTTTAPTTPPPATNIGTTPADREDEIATLKVKLLEPIRFHTDNLGRYAGILKLAELATGEIINAVLGDDPKGEVEAQLGGPEAPGYPPGAELVIVGTWKSGWVILTAVGAAK